MTDLLHNKRRLELLVTFVVSASILLTVFSLLGHSSSWLKMAREIVLFLAIFLFPGYLLWRYLFSTARTFSHGESKRGEAPLPNSTPSPFQGEGDKGSEVDRQSQTVEFDNLERVPLYFSFSVAFWSVLGLAYFYLYLPLDYTIGLFLLVLMALSVKLWFAKRDLPAASEDTFPIPQITIRWYYLALLAVVAIFSGLLWLAAPYQHVDFDTYFHLAGVRKIAERDVWLNADQFLGKGAPAQLPYAANTWYLMIAVFSKMAWLDVTEIYVALTVLLTVVAVLAFYMVVKTLIGSKFLSLVAAIAYVFYLFVIYTYQVSGAFKVLYPTFMPYPGETLRSIVFPVLFAVLVRYIVSGQRRLLLALALLAIALVTVHLQFIIYVMLTLGAIGLLLLFIKKYRQHFFRTVLATGVVLAVAIAFLIPKVWLANSTVATSYMELPFWLNPDVVQQDYLFITKDWYLLNFSGLFARTGVHFLVSLLVLPLIFLPRFKVDRLKAILFASVAVLLFVIYNPLVVPLLVKTVSWVVPRRIGAFSHWAIYLAVLFSVIALLITYPQRILRESKLALLPLVVIVMLGVITASLPVFSLALAQAVNNEGQYASILDLPKNELIQFLSQHVKPESVIAADLETSYLIGALTSHYVLAVTPNRMGVGGDKALLRLMDAVNISSLNLPPKELRKAMDRYGSKYLVLSPSLSSGDRFQALAGSVTTVYDSAGWRVITFER